MKKVLLRRLIGLPFILLGITAIMFLISQVIPADPARVLAPEGAPQSVRDAITRRLGLDQPLMVQYGRYLLALMQGDLGTSTRYNIPVADMISRAFPATLQLIVAGLVVSVVISVPLGTLAALRPNSFIDFLARGIAIAGMAIPAFFLGILMILVFGLYLGWFPVSGRGDPPSVMYLVMPALVLGLRQAGNTMRLLRTTMIEVLGSDYVRAARARGLSWWKVDSKYAFRNATIPATTDLGLNVADMVGSVVLVETVFAWPGIGSLVVTGISNNDFPLITGSILVLALYAIVINILVDILYSALDPRIRLA